MTSENQVLEPDDIAKDPEGTYEYVEEVVEYKDTRRTRTLLTILLIILILLLSVVGYSLLTRSGGIGGSAKPFGVEEMTWVRSIYGWGDTQEEHLITPNSVDIGPDGMIWCNSQNRYAVAFNPDGTFDRILMSDPSTQTPSGAPEETKPDEPQAGGVGSTSMMGDTSGDTEAKPGSVSAVFSVAVDGDNNLFIGDDSQYNILKFTPEGKLQDGWNIPGMVKISANDTRVAVVGKGSLGVFEQSSGSPVFSFGTRGQGTEQFDLPVGVHIDDDGYVYVADTQNQRVRKYSPQGKLLWDAGTVPDRTKPQQHDGSNTQATKGIFELPTGVTVDGNGHVVVIDAFKFQIIVLDGETGEKVADYGDYGPLDGQFMNPSAIAYDAERDYFVIADTDNNRLQVVRLPDSSKSPVQSAIRRVFDRPVWILCMPFLILLIAAIITAILRRRRGADIPQASA